MVPIVESEILIDGPYDINEYDDVTDLVFVACYMVSNDYQVLLEGTLLKGIMVTPVSDSPKVAL